MSGYKIINLIASLIAAGLAFAPREARAATCAELTCDDGDWCDGTERCVEVDVPFYFEPIGFCLSDNNPPCGEEACFAASHTCFCPDPDKDGDGHAAIDCGGDDCDDNDPGRYPGAFEVCDTGKVDEDCDPSTFGTRDDDGDGHISAACCNGEACGDDCDDSRPGVVPGAQVCDKSGSAVMICGPNGKYLPSRACSTAPGPGNLGRVCVAQVNGAGVCAFR